MTKLDGLDAKQQEKTQSIDEEKDLELDEFEKQEVTSYFLFGRRCG